MPMSTELSLRVVRVYKHLGTQALPTAALSTAWAYRSQLALQTSGVLRANIRSRTYTQATKKTLAATAVHSRLLYATATWHVPVKSHFPKYLPKLIIVLFATRCFRHGVQLSLSHLHQLKWQWLCGFPCWRMFWQRPDLVLRHVWHERLQR